MKFLVTLLLMYHYHSQSLESVRSKLTKVEEDIKTKLEQYVLFYTIQADYMLQNTFFPYVKEKPEDCQESGLEYVHQMNMHLFEMRTPKGFLSIDERSRRLAQYFEKFIKQCTMDIHPICSNAIQMTLKHQGFISITKGLADCYTACLY